MAIPTRYSRGYGPYTSTLPGVEQPAIQGEVFIKIGELTLNTVDVALLFLCPLGAALGVLVSFVIKQRQLNSQLDSPNVMAVISSYIGTIFSGIVLGLLLALFFVGAIANEVTALARVVALSILLGYQSRHLWYSQEGVIKKLINKQLETMLESKPDNDKSPPTTP
jgi:hypothetical protein